ncbi:MAG: cation:proton antiporter [Fimbriimonadaceae bacterium]|nr:cation:proton antiporter [Fimbriimonadaceae bacterium]
MPELALNNLTAALGLVGVVVVAAALLSGLIERSNFPQVGAFVLLGLALGPHGAGLFDVGLASDSLRFVATLSLASVLFLDAMSLDLVEVRRRGWLAALILGPGTIVVVAILTFGGMAYLGLEPMLALILAAGLGSTDPVLLRGLLRRPDLPMATRTSLRLESGLNDIVLMPIVLVAMASIQSQGQAGGLALLGQTLGRMLVVGPLVGFVLSAIAVRAMVWVRKKLTVRRDYEALYSLGIALTAFAAGEATHTSGYLACFGAGLAILLFDEELCDCFHEFGQTIAELLLLLTFVFLGGSLLWSGFGVLDRSVVLFVVLALGARPLVMGLALLGSKLDIRSRRHIVWFGPRGLSTLLLVLVPVFERTKGAEAVFPYAALVVVVSILLHGGTAMLSGRRAAARPAEAEPNPIVQPLAVIQEWSDIGRSVVFVDARSHLEHSRAERDLAQAVRIDPDFVAKSIKREGLAPSDWQAVFCSCLDDVTAIRVARAMRRLGLHHATAVRGGWKEIERHGYETVEREASPR